jgi:membrane fusion protein (multidrug efflux system)
MKYTYLLIALVVVSACSKPANELESKKKELDEALNEMITLKEKVSKLENEIREIDPTFAKNRNAVLITLLPVEAKPFEHYIDVRGAIESHKNVALSSMSGGKIERVLVTEGQPVSAGQTLVTIEADILRKSISEVKTSLELAETLYKKQEKLWQQKIGTELQYLQAKNNKESLENKLQTLNAQLEQTIIRAPFAGAIDKVDALVGEMAAPGMPLVRMVNPNDMYVKADVSEDYIGKFSAGDKVEIFLPSFGTRSNSTINSVGNVINPENRTFRVELKFNSNIGAKPNQVAVVSFRDYLNKQVISVPTKIIQRDNRGQFVFVTEKKEASLFARKVYVKLGQSYQGYTEVLEGLEGHQSVVNEGFRELTEGAAVTIASQSSEKEIAIN